MKTQKTFLILNYDSTAPISFKVWRISSYYVIIKLLQ